MRMKRYFEQVASGGGAFGFFYCALGGGGVLWVVLISDGTGTVSSTVFESPLPSLCRQVRASSLKLDKDYLLLQTFHFIHWLLDKTTALTVYNNILV
jgi:hypothetical protein